MRPLSSYFYAEWVQVRDGRATLIKGRIPNRIVSELTEVFREFPGTKGHVCSQGNGRYGFSRSIPEPLRQRVRNVLACR